MNVRTNKLAALAALGLTGALALSACGGGSDGDKAGGSDKGGAAADVSGSIAGAGASSMKSAQEAWMASFQGMHPEAQVTYDGGGSGKGREAFLNGAVQFAGSDSAMKEEELKKASEGTCQGGNAMDIPAYISPIAVVFNLKGVDSLNLSPEALGGIFSGKITKWNDPKIVADNPDAKLPDTKIIPVNRSDKSGTTGNFTDYLAQTAPKEWTAGKVEEWPIEGTQSGNETSGMIEVVKGADGTIGYADASKAGDLTIAKIKVGDTWAEPSAEGAAKVVDISPIEEGRTDNDFAVKLDRTTTESGAYPLLLVSYLVVCDTYKDAKTADLVKAYASYMVSEEGQKAASKASGSAPLSGKIAEDSRKAVEAIKAKG